LLEWSGGAVLSRKHYPSQSVLRIPTVETPNLMTVPSLNPDEPNTTCEVYIQVGKDNVRDRVLMDLLMHMMGNPMYDQIRTQDQFGYDVHCDVRWTYGIIGCIFHVTTNVKSSTDVVERVDKFLLDYHAVLVKMSLTDFQEHLVGLAKQKLDMFNALSDETDCLWSEIYDGRFEWEAWRNETICLKSISKDDVLAALNEWMCPGSKRNILAVQVIGSGKTDASIGRPVVETDQLVGYAEEQVQSFHKLCKNQLWGRVNSKLF
jgi:secreted Zn-dependent insulinase-like peptidase